MKNRFKKLAAILGIAVMVTSQCGVIPVHAEETTAQNSAIQAATNVRKGADCNVYFTNPNAEDQNVDFSGILTRPDNSQVTYNGYGITDDGGCFFTSEYITESGSYSFVVKTYDKSNNSVVGEASCTWKYTKPLKQLSAPEELSWDDDGILLFKKVDGTNQYGLNVYDSNRNSVIAFGSNMLGNFKKEDNGYVKIALSKYLYYEQGITVGNGYYVQVRATSIDLNDASHSDWATSNAIKTGSTSVPASSSKSAEESAKVKTCAHEYEWVTERDATVIANGEEIYQCKYCGHVKERMEMANSAYAKFNKDAIQAIDKAPINGTVTIKTDMWVSFYASVIDTLKSRPDVTVVLNYFYKGTRYTLTIPSGADLSALVESDGYYGFRYLDTFFPGQEIE